LISRKVSPNNSKSSKPTKSKTKERIHFFPEQGESTSRSNNCIHGNEEDSLRRVTAYNRCTKKDPPRFVLSDDEDDVVVDQNEKNDDVTPKVRKFLNFIKDFVFNFFSPMKDPKG